jgi:PAS domain S-box-containing protein
MLMVTWSAIILGSLIWNGWQQRQAILSAARIQARVTYQKDIIYRRWNAVHGGVYVPVTADTAPNPYLTTPHRDITTPSGVRLTLMNPSYMTRQAHELGEEAYGIRAHITSLKPIRPENAADPWETRALEAFEKGAEEVSSTEQIDGASYMRLMRPLVTEQSCLDCHDEQGYKLGDIRGGISVSVPMAPLWSAARFQLFALSAGHGLIWLIVMVGIGFLMRRMGHQIYRRRGVEDALRESERKFRKVFESSNDAIMLLDEKAFFDCNDSTLEIFGFASRAEFCSKHPGEVSPPTQPDGTDSIVAANERIATAFREGRNFFEWMHRRADGEDFPAEVLLTPLELGGRKVLQATVRDITDRKRAEERLTHTLEKLEKSNADLAEKTTQLERANIKLQELDHLKSMFIASMSHELRTPLNSILGFTGILLQEMAGPLNDEQKRQLDMVNQSGKHLFALITDIIDLSKIEAGKVEPLIGKFNLPTLVREVKDSLSVAVSEKGLDMPLVMPEELVVESDERRVKQVIMNLANNAVKFTKEGSVEIAVERKDGTVEVRVADTGIGIQKKEMGKLFKSFSQITAESGPREGTGLGLYLSKKIADLLGGTLSAESEHGRGSTFTFTLPLKYEGPVT